MRHFSFRVAEELYDSDSDPNALRNLAVDGDHATELERMRQLMLRTMERTGDPLLRRYTEFLEGQPDRVR